VVLQQEARVTTPDETPDKARVVRRAVPWLVAAAVVLGVLLVGPQLLLRGGGPVPGEYEVDFGGDGDAPAFASGETFEAVVSPVGAPRLASVPQLTVGAVDPLGHPVVLADRLRVQFEGGSFRVDGDVDELFGDQAGTWRLLFVLSPPGSEPAGDLVLRHGWEIKARPDGSVDWPGNRRVVIRSIVVGR